MRRTSRGIRLFGILVLVLSCAGIGVASYLKLSVMQQSEDASLYALVPSSALAVADTDDARRMARLFTGLQPRSDENKILVSFHEINRVWEQVLYCGLHGVTDCDSLTLPSRPVPYKREKIHIYPMPDGRFLACCRLSGNMAFSYSKKLIEEVIDTHHAQTSLLSDVSFTGILEDKKQSIPATVYARLAPWGWTEFDMQLSDSTILFSGTVCRTEGVVEVTTEVGEILKRLIRADYKQIPIKVTLTPEPDGGGEN